MHCWVRGDCSSITLSALYSWKSCRSAVASRPLEDWQALRLCCVVLVSLWKSLPGTTGKVLQRRLIVCWCNASGLLSLHALLGVHVSLRSKTRRPWALSLRHGAQPTEVFALPQTLPIVPSLILSTTETSCDRCHIF